MVIVSVEMIDPRNLALQEVLVFAQCMETHYRECETLFIEITVEGMIILVGVVYYPHGNKDIFESTVSDIIVIEVFKNDLFNTVKAERNRALCNRKNLSIFIFLQVTNRDKFFL